MTLGLMPDTEALVSSFLREQPEVTDRIGQRVYSVVPADVGTTPFVRVNQFDSDNVTGRLLHLEQCSLQVDVWGGPKATAFDIAAIVRSVLHARLVGVHDEGVVTRCATSSFRYSPDDVYQPARPRFTFDALIHVHPSRLGS